MMVKEKDQENRFLICFLVSGKERNKWMITVYCWWLFQQVFDQQKKRPGEKVSR
jgi:hypothetical protein